MSRPKRTAPPVTDWRKQARDFLMGELNQLVGKTVVAVILEPDPDGGREDYPVLVLKGAAGKHETFAIVQSDAEGNGPGYLRIVEKA